MNRGTGCRGQEQPVDAAAPAASPQGKFLLLGDLELIGARKGPERDSVVGLLDGEELTGIGEGLAAFRDGLVVHERQLDQAGCV